MKVIEKSAPEEIAAPGAEKPPYKGKIKRLPPDLRAEFDRRLVAGAFSDYRGLARWLRENGYSISHTALARYGRALDRKLEALKLATEQARAPASDCTLARVCVCSVLSSLSAGMTRRESGSS